MLLIQVGYLCIHAYFFLYIHWMKSNHLHTKCDLLNLDPICLFSDSIFVSSFLIWLLTLFWYAPVRMKTLARYCLQLFNPIRHWKGEGKITPRHFFLITVFAKIRSISIDQNWQNWPKNGLWAIKTTVQEFFPFFCVTLSNIYMKKSFREKEEEKSLMNFL